MLQSPICREWTIAADKLPLNHAVSIGLRGAGNFNAAANINQQHTPGGSPKIDADTKHQPSSGNYLESSRQNLRWIESDSGQETCHRSNILRKIDCGGYRTTERY